MKIATFLENHPKVTRCVYPGLDSFPQKELADRQHRDNLHGGMLWFDVKGDPIKLMDTIKRPWTLCENLGATESIITACAVMTHANMLKEDRLKVGIVDGFIRISVGIEDPDDLIRSLDDALNAVEEKLWDLAWTVGPLPATNQLSKQSSAIGGCFGSSLKPPSTVRVNHYRTTLFQSSEDTAEVSAAKEMRRSAERIRLQAEEMEMKLIQEKLEGLTKKLDKLSTKIANVEPAESEKNLKLVEEKIRLTRQIQQLKYRLNPEGFNTDPSMDAAIPPPAGVSEDSKVAAADDDASDGRVTLSVNLDDNKISFVKTTNGNETVALDEGMSEEEMMKKMELLRSEDIENIFFQVGEDGFDLESMFNVSENRNGLWQSNETEFVGPLSAEDLKTIDGLEEIWQRVLGLREASKKKEGKRNNMFNMNAAMSFVSQGDDDGDEESKKRREELDVAEGIAFAEQTFAEARAGNISSDELKSIQIVSGVINFCGSNLPFLVEVAMNMMEGYKIGEEDPLYMERFNLFVEAYAFSLFSLKRNPQEDDIEKIFCKEVLDPNSKLFSRTAKPRRVGSAFLIDGKAVERDGTKLVNGLKEAVEKSSLKDKVNLFYVRDPSPQIELDEVQQADFIQTNGGEDDIGRALELANGFEPPALLVTGKNLDTDKPVDARVGYTTFALLDLITTIGACYYPNMEPNYGQEFFTGIESPILIYLLGTFALQHAIQVLLALKGGFKISPLPTLIPGLWGIPLVGSAVFINSPPKNKNDMFDFGFLAPFVGFLVSYGFIVLGLESTMQMTSSADIAQLPHFELDALKQSFLTSATIESVIGTDVLLSMGDGVSSSVPLDPMVIAGHLGLMINAIQMLPTLTETNGGRAASAALGRFSVGYGGLVGLVIVFLLVQSSRGGSPTLDFVALLYTFRLYFQAEMPCQNDVDNASSTRLVALGISLALAALALSPA
ncbi:MAG: hypothetical protein SGBAC_008414 [Bacillariaceae sp.]